MHFGLECSAWVSTSEAPRPLNRKPNSLKIANIVVIILTQLHPKPYVNKKYHPKLKTRSQMLPATLHLFPGLGEELRGLVWKDEKDLGST